MISDTPAGMVAFPAVALVSITAELVASKLAEGVGCVRYEFSKMRLDKKR